MTDDQPIRFRTFADEDDNLWGQPTGASRGPAQPQFRHLDSGGVRENEPSPTDTHARTWGGLVAWGTGLALVAGIAIAVMLLPRHSALAGGKSTPGAALQVHRVVAQPSRLSSGALLPCYVDGASVGSRSLTDCGQRNGVASGQLDVGLTPKTSPSPILAIQAQPAPTSPPPVRQVTRQRIVDQPPRPAAEYADRSDEESADPADSLRAAQTFYEGLADGDGARAASAVVPEKRGRGPLSAGAIGHFYSDLQAPLRLTRLYPLDDHTVMANYTFVDRNGAVCRGSARVTTTERDGESYVRSVRALNGC